MEKDRNKILGITLEILYLLTGEDYVVVKKSGEDQILGAQCRAQITTTGPPLSFMSTERSSDQKIMELTNKIIDLLTGEEWEYLEGHKDLYKDFMMENQPPFTSPDGSNHGNPPERCHRPLYSWDSPWEDHIYVHHDQGEELKDIKAETKEEEKILVSRDQYSLEKSIPLYSQNFSQEVPSIPHQIQNEELKYIKAEIKEEEEMLVSGDQQSVEEGELIMESKQEESSLHIDTSGHCVSNNVSSEFKEEENPTTQCSPGEDLNTQIFHRPYLPERSMDPSNPEESSDDPHTITAETNLGSHRTDPSTGPSYLEGSSLNHEGSHTGERSLSSTVSGNSSKETRKASKQQKSNKRERPECGKCFNQKVNLVNHQRIHTECGKCFVQKEHLRQHQKSHTGACPYSCSECGKCFIQNEALLIHQRVHTGERPYSCSECEKCFKDRGSLRRHQKIHTDRPYSCLECGKLFHQTENLLIHQKSHIVVRPYSCSECGKGFIQKRDLVNHQRVHTGERPYSCSECGKSFTQKSTLDRHQKVHMD
ncbi:hypothetical protein AB205_0084550, partial [Aquarana catesbeiana]